MRQWTIDAFTTTPFRGNAACVVEPFDVWPAQAWMQALARENNQSETVFLRRGDRADTLGLRWFTPTSEVDLCGHGTLAAAHMLHSELETPGSRLRFDTRSGDLEVTRQGDRYVLDFPSDPPIQAAVSAEITAALSVVPLEVWAGRYLVAVLQNETEVHALRPDLNALSKLANPAGEAGQVLVCAPSDDPEFDLVDRFFAPGCGIDEDPVTGSAHCILAPLYAAKSGKTALKCRQVFPGRGGVVETRLAGDRVLLIGPAVTTMRTELLHPAET